MAENIEIIIPKNLPELYTERYAELFLELPPLPEEEIEGKMLEFIKGVLVING